MEHVSVGSETFSVSVDTVAVTELESINLCQDLRVVVECLAWWLKLCRAGRAVPSIRYPRVCQNQSATDTKTLRIEEIISQQYLRIIKYKT